MDTSILHMFLYEELYDFIEFSIIGLKPLLSMWESLFMGSI